MLDLKSISKSLQDAARSVLEAKKPIHPNQQKIDVHEPEKDEITAKDFEMLRTGKKIKMKEEVEDTERVNESLEIANLILSYSRTACLNEYFEKEHIGSSKNYHVHSVDPEIGSYHLTHKKTGKKIKVEIGDNYPNNTTRKIKNDLHRQVPNSDIHSIARKINKHLQGDEAGEIRRELKNEEQVDEVNFADVVARQKAKHGGTLPDKYPAAKKTASNLDVGTSKASKVYSGKPQHKDIFGHDTKSQAAGATGPRASVMQKVHNKIKSFFTKEDIDVLLDADEVLLTTPIMVELKESYTFGDYLVAAKAIVGEDNAVELANFAFNEQATELFVEQATRGDIESKIASHKAAGHMVSEPKYKTKDGKLHAEYVVTDKESGIRRKYIQHGTSRKVENMGTKGKKDDE